jgi:hypothetical protein
MPESAFSLSPEKSADTMVRQSNIMSYRMPFPLPFLPMLLVAAISGSASIWLIKLFSSARIRETQTAFAISQIVDSINQTEDAGFPRTTPELMNTLRASSIDWNSCRMEGDGILDAWGRPMTAVLDEKDTKWSIRSFGKDGRNGTGDDIERATSGDKGGGSMNPKAGCPGNTETGR